MKDLDLSLVFEYINLERNSPLGCGELAPLIKMVNDRKQIVKELLDKEDNKHVFSVLSFLDYGLRNGVEIKSDKRELYNDDITYRVLNMEDTLNAIFYVLETFRDLDEDVKWKINGEEFVKLLKERR